jgi:hypothetical protein
MSVEFTLEGLTPKQMVLADMIWECQTGEQVKAFVRSLPTPALRKEASTIVELMKMAVIEQCYDGISSMDESKQVLRKYNTKRG